MSSNIITSSTGTKWEYVIGLEVHAQISSKSKLFSVASTEFGAAMNTQVSLFDAAFPGMLPTLNGYCVEQAIKTGIALNATVNTYSVFDRKNYFYPDLPSGYQISQFYYPIVQNGSVEITTEDGSSKIIQINRLHLEQDAGKSLHGQSPNHTLIDLNRAGIGLMEIVTDPVITSPFEACEYLKKLRSILRCIGSCDGDMEKGSLRCDANISVRKPGEPLGIRCEIKNLNSTKNLIKAIEFEAVRQIMILEEGGVILQETRLFDAEVGETRSMRLKSDEADYRYFPDPDLLPISFSKDLITSIAKTLPELPDAKIRRFQEELAINKYDAGVIVADEKTATYFEQAAEQASPKIVANWMISELFGLLNKNSLNLDACKITPIQLANMINLIEDKVISGKIAKEVFQIMFETGEDPKKIIEQRGLSQLSNVIELERIILQVLKENNDSLIEYKNGKEKLFGFFVGQVMKKTNGKANPNLVNELLKKKLGDIN